MTAEEFRAAALALPEATEGAHVGHPDFRVADRVFASLLSNEEVGGLCLLPAEQRELVRLHPAVFTPASGAWGRQGWTTVLLADVNASIVRGALLLAYEHVLAKSRERHSATKHSRRPRPRRVHRKRH